LPISRLALVRAGEIAEAALAQHGLPGVLGFSPYFLQDGVERVEQSFGEWDRTRDAAIIEAELESALTTLESNEFSNFAYADQRRHP
jgi:hypothetical protein